MAVFCVWKDKDALAFLRNSHLPEICLQNKVSGADAILLQAGQTAPKTVLKAAVVPESMAVSAKQLVTYGTGSRSTVTLSSVSGGELLLCLQREIVNLRGIRLDQQEFTLPARDEPERMLALASALLLAGAEPERLPVFFDSKV